MNSRMTLAAGRLWPPLLTLPLARCRAGPGRGASASTRAGTSPTHRRVMLAAHGGECQCARWNLEAAPAGPGDPVAAGPHERVDRPRDDHWRDLLPRREAGEGNVRLPPRHQYLGEAQAGPQAQVRPGGYGCRRMDRVAMLVFGLTSGAYDPAAKYLAPSRWAAPTRRRWWPGPGTKRSCGAVLLRGSSRDGLAYNPRPPLADAARDAVPAQGFAAAWTGRQVLVWGGLSRRIGAQVIPPHGEAYSPAANRWTGA